MRNPKSAVKLQNFYGKNHHFLSANNSIHTKRDKKDSLRIALEGVLLISWRLPTLPRVCSTIGVTGLNFSVRNGKRWNPGAITTRMGDMMNATLYLQTTNSLKKCAEETKPRGFYAMIYRSFLFSLIVFATRSEVRLTAYTGMILIFPLSCASYI